MENVVIRRPSKNDIEPLNEFYKFVIKDTFIKNGIADLVEDYEKAVEEKRKFLKEDLDSCGQNRYFLLATVQGRIVGSIAYGPSNEDINSTTDGILKSMTEIGSVFVHPDYQQKGIGSTMFGLIYKELNKKGVEEFCLDSGYKIAQGVWIKKFGAPKYHFIDFWGKDTNYMIWVVKLKDVL